MHDGHLRARVLKAAAFVAAMLLIGAGCPDAPTPAPPAPPVEAAFDVTKTTCDEIAAARAKVAAAYEATHKAATDTYTEAHAAFRADFEACRRDLWKGGPCDKEYAATQTAYQNAWGDISNDQFYKEWKKAKADWDACHAQWDAKYEEWSKNGQEREKACQEEFQAKSDAARAAYDAAAKAAREKRDADNAFLDELEKKCKQPTATGGTTGVVPGGTGTPGGTNPPGGGTNPPGGGVTVSPPVTPPNPNSPACRDAAIPGENGTPRTGRASDFGPKDILVNLLTAVAEDVTGTPIPTSAINDQIFAGIVCTKLHARLIELHMEEIDAITSGDRRAEIALRQKIARYERARNVWCSIAQGKPALADVKKEVNAINAMPTGACKTDADCGQPVCCSGQEVGSWTCNTATGACSNQKTRCTDPKVCGGTPARCVAPPQKVKAINVGGKFLPLDQLIIESEPGCGADHYHAKRGAVKATDGTTVPDPGPQCGYGKVSERPTVEVMTQIDTETRVEIRGGMFGR